MITTTLVSVKTCFSSSTRSAFCDRSMPTPKVRPRRCSGRVPTKAPAPKRRSNDVRGALDRWRCKQRTTKRSRAPNDSCPRLGCKLSPRFRSGQQLSRTVRAAKAASEGAPIKNSAARSTHWGRRRQYKKSRAKRGCFARDLRGSRHGERAAVLSGRVRRRSAAVAAAEAAAAGSCWSPGSPNRPGRSASPEAAAAAAAAAEAEAAAARRRRS